MRLPFPERVSLHYVALFAALLFVIQQLEGTALYFSAGCTAFILIAGIGFNLAGGFTRAAGAYLFFYSLLVVIVGVCHKAFLGEPGQSNLLDPETDIKVYVGGITAMVIAILVSRRLSRAPGILSGVLKESQMFRASVGCIVFGIAGGSLIALLGESAFRLETAFTQLNVLLPLGVIIGVMHEIRRSGGTRSVNLPIMIGAIYSFSFYGLLYFSKQGMLLPIVCWLLPICASRFRLSRLQIAGCALCSFFLFYYLMPYSQYIRRFSAEVNTISDRAQLCYDDLILDPGLSRRMLAEEPILPTYFNTPQGFWDRLQMVSVDDGLVNVTDNGKVFGLMPIKASILNAVPHFLWPNKPDFNFGNAYAHEVGPMSEEDVSTGISFSPTAEAYHMARWVGVFVVAPIVWCVLFVEYDWLVGDLRTTPWGLMFIALISHTAPEGMLSGTIYLMTFSTEAIIFCAFFSAWVAPYFAIAVLGPERQFTAWSPPIVQRPVRQSDLGNRGDSVQPTE